MIKVLLLEDNKTISDNIANYLGLEHIDVDVFADGESALIAGIKNKYDVLLLDIMVPRMDGIAVCKKIREKSNVPVIMLTAKGQMEDKIQGFACGADDYLVKPFDLEELSLRIRAIIKRDNKWESFRYENIEVVLDSRKVTKNGKEIPITIKEFHILEYLIKNYGIAVSRTDIIEFVRGSDAIWGEDNKLDVYIANLRKKLNKTMISTIKGFGYQIEKR